ncbi:hypothetical protein [Priestia megaterium]|uniref:hypothetical protein n=1 Tax=Priestia megaterium TaxID=1404 RepID=UPI001BE61E0B|nr:hypothetical protein [Priestia megaterium]MBT2254439.1 hypothetical protein [Priestia megaterium]MBT2280494.1 hypothetical protein [Priestia megaterium]
MSTYSLEQSAENIYHPKTKEYFSEVLQSYINGSYRSAVVMLYSVVMCDLIYKLKDLKELYEDETARSILDQIEAEQGKEKEGEGRKGSWETILIDEVKKRTSLLEPADEIALDTLRRHRHLSAHPVLTQQDLLSTPNKETVRALIRNMLDGLLTKNPVMSKKVVDTILEDLEQHKGFFTDDVSLENYIDSRYLKNTNEQIINTIFKSLWGITFNCASDRCKKNRLINYRVLKILYKKYKPSLLKFIKSNSISFNKFKEDDQNILMKLVELFGNFPELYEFVEGHNKTKLEGEINKKWKYKVISPFLRESMEAHFDYLIKEIHWTEHSSEERFYEQHILDRNETNLLLEWASEHDCLVKYYDLLIKQFIHSSDFNTADYNFDKFIEPNLKHFNREQFLDLYDGINRNRQCYAQRYAKGNNTKIKIYSDVILGGDFKYKEKYRNVEFAEK